jgi:hypothetical protein
MILLLKFLAVVAFIALWFKAFIISMGLLSTPSEVAFVTGIMLFAAIAFIAIRLVVAGIQSTAKLAQKQKEKR